jgi:hypothetical protein
MSKVFGLAIALSVGAVLSSCTVAPVPPPAPVAESPSPRILPSPIATPQPSVERIRATSVSDLQNLISVRINHTMRSKGLTLIIHGFNVSVSEVDVQVQMNNEGTEEITPKFFNSHIIIGDRQLDLKSNELTGDIQPGIKKYGYLSYEISGGLFEDLKQHLVKSGTLRLDLRKALDDQSAVIEISLPAGGIQTVQPQAPVTSSAGSAIVFDPPSNVRSAPNGGILCLVRERTTINIYGKVGDWYNTDACGQMGVIHSSQVKF